jgi:hypothetical protein
VWQVNGNRVERCFLGKFPGVARCRKRGATERRFFWLVRLVNVRADSVRYADREEQGRRAGDSPHDT